MNKFVYDLLKQRYLWEWKIDNKTITETPEQMILRVSKKVQSQYLHFCKHKNKECYKVITEKQKLFYHLIKSGDFIPSSPQLFNQMRGFSPNFDEKDKYEIIYKPIDDTTVKEWDIINNFTNPKQAFGSCYSFGRIDDTIESIYTYLWEQQETFRAGGGYGVSFSNLRENGQYVKSIGGSSCGPIEFMRLFNLNTKLIQLHQKTKRGQNMFSLSVYHPDIEEFIDRKTEFVKDKDLYGETYRPKYLEHQNISVEIDNNFIKQLKEDKEIELVSPSSKKVIKKIKQKKLWDKIIYNNWKTADPGILNFDIMNQKNPLKDIEPITSTNPCAEYVGFPYTVCNLGSVNLWNMLDKKNNKIDLQKLQETTELQTEYLNYALWQNEYPLKKLTERSRQYRPIGLGFMGLASTFVYLGYKYGDDNSKRITKEIIEEMMYHTIKKSNELVSTMGTFEHYDKSTFKDGKFYFKNEKYKDEIKDLLSSGVVNSRFMSIAPTGSISLLAQGLSSKDQSSISGGIEPIFALSYKRQVNPNTDKQYLIDQNDISLIPTLKKLGLNNDEIKSQIDSLNGKKRDKIFNDDRFRTSQELSYEEHLSILEIVSHQIDMSISKTINVPNETTPEEISKIYLDFIERGIQGGTIYRDGSRQQILKEVKQKEKDKEDKKKINLFMSDLSFNKKGKIEPKKRPVLMEQIKKTIKMKNGDKELIFHIDVGFAEDAEPFEVFIRQTQSTKEYSEMFNQIGRLVSLQFRSNLSIDETLNQIKKVKNWKNEYSPVQKTIVDTINEIINVRKLKGKKKEQLIDKINEKAGWIRTPKGYYIDNDGKMRCPICNGEVIAHDGCYSCKNGDWNQCS